MQTIKTAVVVVLLLFVLYGGYVALNGTDTKLSDELESLVKIDEPDISGPTTPTLIAPGNGGNNGFSSFNNSPPPSFEANKGPATSPFAFPAPSGAAAPAPSSTMLPPPSNSASLQPSPLLAPAPNANGAGFPPPPSVTTSSSTQGSLPSFPTNALGSSVGSNVELASTNSSEDSKFVSTNAPNFGLAVPHSNLPSDLGASGFPDSSHVPSLELSNHGGNPGFDDPSLNETDVEPRRPASASSRSYENAKDLAMDKIKQGDLKEALSTLSVFYNAPELTSDQRQDLLDLLDALAREVVFSRRHLLDMPYIVAPGETLEQIAKRYQIPTELLAKINAFEVTSQLPSGARLKVVPGPFRAEVDLTRSELTLFVEDLYAARFPVSLGTEPAPKPGVFQVLDKQRNRNYYGNGGVNIPATDPRNPFGGWWIDLGQDFSIHGTAEAAVGTNRLGCISLSPLDANDVFGMLIRGSQVTVRR